jgi:hypothetical protein
MADDAVLRDWDDACARHPAAMTACYEALMLAPYPDEWLTRNHGPMKDAAQYVGSSPAWEWRINDLELVIYRRAKRGPVVIHCGPTL